MDKLWQRGVRRPGVLMNRSAPVQPQDAPPAGGTSRAPLPVSRPRLRGGGVAASLLALVVLGYIGLWGIIALELRSDVLDWISARQAEGYRIAHSNLAIGGFPRVARVTVMKPVIAAPDGRALGWSWAGDQAAVETDPLHPDAVVLRLAGEESVAINIDGKLRTYRGGAEELTLRLAGGASPPSTSLVAKNLAMAAEEPGDVVEVERLSARGSVVKPSAAKQPTQAYGVTIDATGIQLPGQLNLPLGEALTHLSTDVVVRGALAPRSNLPDALTAWRDRGGEMELSQLSVRYGPLLLEGSGTAALDADLQPVGTLMARIQGFQQTVSALAGRGLIDETTAARAKVALAILSRPGADGGPTTLSVPLSLHDRRLSVGPLPLLVLPMIEWPRGPNPRNGDLSPLVLTKPG